MSTPSSPVRHNYAAPHTPIASAKRLKVTRRELVSPIKNPQLDYGKRTAIEESNRKLGHCHDAKSTMHCATPSKNLFSPVLRYENSESDENVANRKEPPAPVPTVVEVDNEEDDDVFNPYLFISSLPPHEVVKLERTVLPSSSMTYRPILVLDLDETLVHCTIDPIANPDVIFPVNFNGAMYQVHAKKRPYLDSFLETVSKTFEVVVFTASQRVYADSLIDLLDPDRRLIHHRLFRESCLLVQGNYLKDLTVLGRDMRKTVLVDNSPYAYGYQLDNGIPIESWFDDEADTELMKLANFLGRISTADDVRPFIHDQFKSFHLVHQARMGIPVALTAPPF